MVRGDLITVALPGDIGKPRPAVVMQSDDYAGTASVFVIPLTSLILDADAFRLTITPSPTNGLRVVSQAMIDKLSPARRDRCGEVIGRLLEHEMEALTVRLVALLGAG